MTEKELREIRRRFNPEKSNISSVLGCLVNEKKEIVTRFNQSITLSSPEEATSILKLLKKTLSGGMGTNLLDIEFKTSQVIDSAEHKLLMKLKKTELKAQEPVDEFINKVIETVILEESYLILLANDRYDVFDYHSDGTKNEDSTAVFSYIICAICPLKPTKSALSFKVYENAFKNITFDAIVSAPELGFLFPTFDDRCENIYNALYYTHDITKNHDEFVERVFNAPLPMPAAVQKVSFDACLRETISDECNFEVVRSVHEQISEMIEDHKAIKEETPLTLQKKTLKNILVSSGVNEDHIESFDKKYDEVFGEETEIRPQNIVDVKKFNLETPDVLIKVNPERRDLVSTQIINGTKYILVRAAEGVEVNGVDIKIK